MWNNGLSLNLNVKLISFVALGKLLCLSDPQFFHYNIEQCLYEGYKN